jgi:hypothetical protein
VADGGADASGQNQSGEEQHHQGGSFHISFRFGDSCDG